jgi:hypothetical protein
MARGKLLLIGLVVLIVAVASVKVSKALPTIPPGIEAQNWRPLTDDVGIALQARRGTARQGPVIGTLMVRDGDRWRSVDLIGAPYAAPAQ